MFTSQELQQLKSLLTEKIDDLEVVRRDLKGSIAYSVKYKKPFVETRQKEVVDIVNGHITEDYKEVAKLDKRLKKLRELQKSVKNALVENTAASRFNRDQDEGWADYHIPGTPNRIINPGFVVQEHKQGSPIPDRWAVDHNESVFWHNPDSPVRSVTLPYVEQPAVEASDVSSKPSNPKDAIGSGKLPIHLWPNTATAMGCIGFLNGAAKYGRSNFRAIGIRASIYYDAAKRHLDAWFESEEVDPDDGVPHLAAALACIAIIVDAQAAGKLNDDRAYPGGYRKLVDELTPLVAQIKKHHEAKNPKHYTIADVQH
jgi:hypothetical protein